MPLPHPAAVLAVAALVGTGSLAATLSHDHGVPERAAVAYLAAARSAPCPLDYRILVAIGAVETGHGTHGGSHLDDAGKEVRDGSSLAAVSYAGAQGPMQFMPATWETYGRDGDGDGTADINDIDDAAAAAAAYLCASNVDEDPRAAVYQYNHDWGYVDDVMSRAEALPHDDGSPAGIAGQGAALPDDKGRICGVGEWLSDGSSCTGEARSKVAFLWAEFGQALDAGDTPRLHAAWEKLNGQQPTVQPVAAPAEVGLAGDVRNVPNSHGLQPEFAGRLAKMFAAAPGDVSITSGFRSTAEQVAIIESHGGECGYMVACVVDGVCQSMHCKGEAADLSFADGAVDQWVHANMGRFGLCQPMSWESWHIQRAETCQ